MTTGKRLEQLRKENKLTLEKIGEILGISYQAYIKYEKDKCYPSAQNLIKISKMYNVSTDYILCISKDKKINQSKQ